MQKTNTFILSWVCLLCLLMLAALIFKLTMVPPHQPSTPSYLSDLIVLTARVTAQNRVIDQDNTFIRAQAINSHTLEYYYNLTNYDTDPTSFDLNLAKHNVIKSVCDAHKSKENPILKLGGTYVFIYGSKNTKEIGRVEINKQSCDLPS
jgi:hypothetical protein